MRRIPVTLVSLVACAVLALGGCESKLSQESYAKIKKGMTLVEVQKILGGSGEEDSSPSGMTISGAGVAGSSKETKEKIYVWKEGGATITVVVVDGKVVEARQSGL
jgi:hypothetical protein